MLVRTIPGDRCVAGITVLDGQLFVLRTQSADIEVYDARASSFQLVSQLTVQRLRQPTDIVASQTATVVFVADAIGCVFVVDPSGKVYSTLQVRFLSHDAYAYSAMADSCFVLSIHAVKL